MPPEVRAAFDAAPTTARAGLLALRRLILDQAARMPEVGPVAEALRWGQPAYLTPVTRSGSTLRLGVPRAGGFALFCNCQTSLIADFRDLTGGTWPTEGNRAVLFDTPDQTGDPALCLLIARALTWHRRADGPGRPARVPRPVTPRR